MSVSAVFLSSTFNPKPRHHFNPTTTKSNPNHQRHINPQTTAAISIPTPPWVKKDSFLTEPNEALFSKPSKPKHDNTSPSVEEKSDKVLTDKISGGRGKKAMKFILQGIEKLNRKMDDSEHVSKFEEFQFSVPLDEIISRPGGDHYDDDVNSRSKTKKKPWTKDEEKVVFRRVKKEKVVTAADRCLDKMLLHRLRKEAARMRIWVKVKKAGITQAVVDQIMFIWSTNELAMIKFDLPLCRNMDRAHEIAEIKTGGMVVWNKKDTLVIYRGHNYKFHPKTYAEVYQRSAGGHESPSLKSSKPRLEDNMQSPRVNSSESTSDGEFMVNYGEDKSLPNSIFMGDIIGSQPVNGSLYERETDRLLDGLGPRFIDWWMPKPLPVDADMLPEVVPGYMPPNRLSPPNRISRLTDAELTYLRNHAQHLPTHFVLGRNRKLQGLAAAIIKLWEKSHIVKIAIKWGVMNTNNGDMAYELKCLTGGVLLLRNKFFIIFYRGKDFLPCGVANLIAERDTKLNIQYLHEEDARHKAAETLRLTVEKENNTSSIGTLSEFQNLQTDFADLKSGCRETVVHLEAEKENVEKELRNQERKLFILQSKIERSTKELLKLNSKWSPSETEPDQELITREERECLRKIALKMTRTLMLGRRGVFDGVMEGIYQHWKHREVVKVITMQRAFTQVIHTAKFLEAESGGILISIEKQKEGHAIIIYRGKNYTRPSKVSTKNLLSKRKALQRSIEMQRIGSLKYIAYQRQLAISDMKLILEDLQNRIQAVDQD